MTESSGNESRMATAAGFPVNGVDVKASTIVNSITIALTVSLDYCPASVLPPPWSGRRDPLWHERDALSSRAALTPVGLGPSRTKRAQDWMKASRSALIVSAWVVGMPCGNPG